jgi:hypothetical protein
MGDSNFLASMTFASGEIACNCDVRAYLHNTTYVTHLLCSLCFVRLTHTHTFSLSKQECECGPSSVPPDIQRAVQEHLKKRKLEKSVFERSQRLNIQQQRELVKRESGFSIWKLVLPRYHRSDPIVEHRNSHRILFVKQMPEVSNKCSVEKSPFLIHNISSI